MTPASDAARVYSRAHSDKFLDELKAMLRIPSLSGDPAHAGDVRRMAEWLAAHMAGLGLGGVEIMETAGHPVVYGQWLGAGPDKPTVLVYGHYDVVPAAIEDGWDSDPFEPVVRDGKVFARGATDDKGQLFVHVKALESYLQTGGAAPVNVKFLIEGEEEVSSLNLTPFIKEHLELLRADVCVVSDTSMRTIDEPAILHSLRGMTYIEVEVRGPKDDLHSGLWGGAVHNPALALSQIMARMFNDGHTIAVPGFYDDVVPLTEAERAMIAMTDLSEVQYKQSTGVPAVWGDAAYNIRERIAARPTLDINGLWSGWAGPGPKTIVPAKAGAKVSCRLVGNQDPHKIYEQLKAYIESLAPPTVAVEVRLITTGKPALFPFDSPAMQAASRAYARGWGAQPIFTRGGGSIPVVADIADLMGIPVVLMGFGLDDDGLHSPNERFSLEMFQRGIETTIVYLEELAHMPALVTLANALEQLRIGPIPLLIGLILVICLLDFIMPAAIPKWAIFAPIFVPLFVQLGVAPQTVLAAYRIGDSPVNVITPLMVYFPFIVLVAQRYDKNAGIGTIISLMLPYTVVVLVLWIILFVVWFVLGIPLGPGYPVGS